MSDQQEAYIEETYVIIAAPFLVWLLLKEPCGSPQNLAEGNMNGSWSLNWKKSFVQNLLICNVFELDFFFSFTVEAVAALGNKVVETLRTQDPSEGNAVRDYYLCPERFKKTWDKQMYALGLTWEFEYHFVSSHSRLLMANMAHNHLVV